MTLLGPTAAADKEEVAQACLDMAQRYPVTIAFVPANDPDSIYVGHTITRFPSDPTAAKNIDGKICCL